MKKLVAVLFVVVGLMSCSQDEVISGGEFPTEEETSTSANKLNSGVNVKLHKAFTANGSRYGIKSVQRTFEVEVRNIAYDKDVAVLHQMGDGSWEFFPMKYVKSTPDNTEIWSYNYSGNDLSYFGDEFVFRYIVDSVEYWDNNDGQNYSMGAQEGVLLGEGINVLKSTGYVGGSSFSVTAHLQNFGYDKEVEVVYTTDGWATSNTASLGYVASQTVGPSGESVPSPNTFGVEFWTNYGISLAGPVQELEYAIVYKVNGQEYWDNNFGQNYQAIIY